ncbi:MAG TPA: hypothetical protein VH375_00415 [Rhodanobacteraceae bacterium]|jgi:hypothetical protein
MAASAVNSPAAAHDMEKVRTSVAAAWVLRAWTAKQERRWSTLAISSRVRSVQRQGMDKAVLTLRTTMHEASVTVWPNRTFEFIVLEYASKRETVSRSGAYAADSELHERLDNCVTEFEDIVLASR